MELPQLATTNVFLGIIAGLLAAQMMAFVAAAFWMKRTVAHVSLAAARFESERVAPLVGEAHQLGGQARQLIAELKSVVRQAGALVNTIDLRTRRTLATVDVVNEAVDAVVHSTWNQVQRALGSGLRRGLSTFLR